MDMELMSYAMEFFNVLMDDSVTEYKGYNPDKECEDILIKKENNVLTMHAIVYSLLEENDMMDDVIDYYTEAGFQSIVVFENEDSSVIRLDY